MRSIKRLMMLLPCLWVAGYPLFSQSEYPVSKFALSANPLGFVQFGPSVHAEIGLTGKLVLNLHLRAPSLGLLSYVIASDEDGLDEFTGAAGGLGLIYFLTDAKNKPYVGGIAGVQKTEAVYAKDQSYEWWENDLTNYFMINGGYRFRFSNGFFINTGAYLGAGVTRWDWDYRNSSAGRYDADARTGTDVTPFGMLELTLGIEF